MSLRSGPLGPFRIRPRVPGDKSITHRAYLLGALAAGETPIRNPNPGADCEATLGALQSLGIGFERTAAGVRVRGGRGSFRPPSGPLDLGNSGTGLRLLLGLLAAQPFETVLTGDASLRARPVERVLDPLRRMGATAASSGDRPPVTLRGAGLTGVRHQLPVPSAQVKSALLLAGVQARGETWIGGAGGTRDHTERMLRAFGAQVGEGESWVSLAGKQALTGTPVDVPGDISAGVFHLLAAALLPGSRVELEGIGLNPTRIKALDILQGMGLLLQVVPDPETAGEPRGRVMAEGAGLRAFDLGPGEVPALIDELPALAVAAAFAHGTSRLRGAGELRVKESDRIDAMVEGLVGIGAKALARDDGWIIDGSGGESLAGGRVRSRGDHRIAMALLVAGFRTRDGVTIVDPPHIETSDPYFESNLKELQAWAA